VFCGIRPAQSVVFGVVLCKSLFVFFLLVIVLSVIFRFTDSDYPFWYIQFFLVFICVKLQDVIGIIFFFSFFVTSYTSQNIETNQFMLFRKQNTDRKS